MRKTWGAHGGTPLQLLRMTTPQRWQEIDRIFAVALEREPSERGAFLDEACAGDELLRKEVESLLAHDVPESLVGADAVQEATRLLQKSPRSSSSSSRGEDDFVAGTMLNGRYRVTGLLGRGAMGEVYKAEDLKLNQTVALKFLPEKLAQDNAALERFYGEVRTARGVSHPNVCRVFDIGEVDGSHFLSMEFIDGDDLSSLLRRIGRLPHDKAVEIARQLCAGLHAIHQVGVLHRDLKPANAIIDGRGKARITDFGIAGLESEFKDVAGLVGTPAYMSPEQITGKELTAKSDIYALGLVLYEIFTGKQTFEGDTVNELLSKHKTTPPTNPSEFVKDIHPLVEQVILRCLEKDPQKRPASAMQVALALPGGDPLQAAMAMGETPSPEMVAAAGEKTGLRPRIAVACLVAVLACLVGLAFLGRFNVFEKIPFENSPEVLAGKGREAIAQVGYHERPLDRAYGLDYNYDYLFYGYADMDRAPDRVRQVENARGDAVSFWYRESPTYLQLLRSSTAGLSRRLSWNLSYADPPPFESGMRGAKLDSLGRLREFYARLPVVEEAKSGEASALARETSVPDWNPLFVLAGIEPSRFTAAEALWNPESAFDARAAWTGTSAEMPDTPLRVEAAAYRGKIVFFKLIFPWTKPNQFQLGDSAFFRLFRVVLLLGAVLLAWRNYRQKRGDRQGAIRVVSFLFVSQMLFWLLTASHVPTIDELDLVGQGVSLSLFSSAIVWAFYIALEPYVRRRWPTSLITWSRLVTGKITDPLVGRDLLIGILLGLCYVLLFKVPSPTHVLSDLDLLLGVRFAAGEFLSSINTAAIGALGFTFILTMLRALLRRDWLAVVVAVLMVALPFLLSASLLAAVLGLIFGSLTVLAFTRFGLLTMAVSLVILYWLAAVAFTTNLSAWYASTQFLVMFIVIALAGYAFYTSLGGQKVFKGKLLED
jgi:serine/threonine protein kinase